jgi:integrase
MPGYIRPRKGARGTTYQARWRPPGDGRDSERRVKTFKTKGAAKRWLTKLDSDHHGGSYVDPRRGDRPFPDVAAEWLVTKEHLDPRTYSDYQSALRTWYLSDRDPLDRRPPFRRAIGRFGTPQIEDWLRGFLPARSHRTMAKTYGVLRQVMAFAVRRGYIAIDPCLSVKLPARPRPDYDPDTGEFIEDEQPPITILSKSEITKLAEAMPTPGYKAAVAFDAWMGLRAGELWALKRKDINPLTGQVHVRRAWKEVNGKHRGNQRRYFLGPVKTKAGKRDIHMPEHIKRLMTEHLASVAADPEAFVFATPDRRPVRQSDFYKKVFKPAVRRVLPHKSQLRFHDLRHTAASFILAVHPNLFLVMQRLGHASMTTTTQTYGHLVGDVDAALAVALDQFYAGSVNVQPLHAAGTP